MTPKKQSKHLYRVNVYLGKELYKELEKTALTMGVSVSTIAKILITTGHDFAHIVDKNTKGGN